MVAAGSGRYLGTLSLVPGVRGERIEKVQPNSVTWLQKRAAVEVPF